MSVELPVRETYGLMPPGTEVAMYFLLAPFAALFLYGVYRRLKLYGVTNIWSELFRDMPARLTVMVRYAVLQRRVVREKLAGLMHTAIYAGVVALFIGTTLVFLDSDILRFMSLSLLRGEFYLFYEFSLDVMGLALMAGLVILVYRRAVSRERRLRYKDEYLLGLLGLIFIGVTGYLMEGIRLVVAPRPWGGWSFVGTAVANLLAPSALSGGASQLVFLYQALWWSHAVVAFLMVSLIPFSNFLHIFTTMGNSYFSVLRHPNPGKMTTPFNLETLEESAEVRLGARRVADFSWRQRLGLDACTDCGRCEAACPAFAAGTPLSPRMVVQKLKDEMWLEARSDGEWKDLFVSGTVGEDEVWACTTCAACVEACPVLISPLEYILDMRRALTFEGKLDRKKASMLAGLARAQNPYGFPQSGREAFLAELRELGVLTLAERPDAEYLYWIGCASHYDARGRMIVRSMVKILRSAGVSFAILGGEEMCTGDPARRMGEEGRFQEFALANIRLFAKYGVRKVLVHCPHCFNTFKNEYSDFGASLQVVHHTQLIGELLRTGRLKLKRGLAGRLTLHDSCYLGRINGIIQEPREVLRVAVGEGFSEMRRMGRNSFCCGAGGANYWYEVTRRERESVLRLREAMETGAGTMVVECPYCLAMFTDSARVLDVEQRIRIADVAEVVAEAIE